MSNALGVAAVSFVMLDLLNNGMIDRNISGAVGNVAVTALPPDLVDQAHGSQLNLFLYQVTHNQGWQNVGYPSRDSEGNRVSNPPLALDLHYLLMAYATEQFHAEILLGYAMQLLHETPILTRDAIRRSLAAPSQVGGGLPALMQNLYTSELAEQVEMIKISPQVMSTDELTKLWTAFQTQYYRASAAYQASVVLIDSRASTRSALPVKSRSVTAIPFQKPVIAEVWSQRPPNGPIVPDQAILPGYNLILKGSQLKGEITSVLIDSTEIVPLAGELRSDQILVPLPPSLGASVHSVQVLQQVLLGSPPMEHRGVESNVSNFVLHPTVTATVSGVAGTGSAQRSGNLDLTLNPPVGPDQRVVVLLNQLLPFSSPIPGVPLSYSFIAPPLFSLQSPPTTPPPPTPTISVPFSRVVAGKYLIRVQVDGAESLLVPDGSGSYATPQVTIP